MKLGDKIRFVRQKKEMSQGDLARDIKTAQKNISRYESDQSTPGADTLKKIADSLGVTTDFLLNDSYEFDAISDTKLLERFQKVEKMDDARKKLVSEWLDVLIRDHQANQADSK